MEKFICFTLISYQLLQIAIAQRKAQLLVPVGTTAVADIHGSYLPCVYKCDDCIH